MADFKPQPKPKNVLDSKRIEFSMPCPVNGVKGWSSLRYYAGNDNPGITVRTGDPGDADNNFGRIQAKFGIMDMMAHIRQLETAARSKEPIKLEAFCQSVRGQDKKNVDVCRVEVGKRPDGVVYVMLEDLEKSNRPKIYFPLRPTRWHHYAKNGVPLTEAELSVEYAFAIADLLRILVPTIGKDTYKHPEPKQGGQGGGGNWKGNNGGNRGGYGGGGGGYNGGGGGQQSGGYNGGSSGGGSDYDDDVPF